MGAKHIDPYRLPLVTQACKSANDTFFLDALLHAPATPSIVHSCLDTRNLKRLKRLLTEFHLLTRSSENRIRLLMILESDSERTALRKLSKVSAAGIAAAANELLRQVPEIWHIVPELSPLQEKALELLVHRKFVERKLTCHSAIGDDRYGVHFLFFTGRDGLYKAMDRALKKVKSDFPDSSSIYLPEPIDRGEWRLTPKGEAIVKNMVKISDGDGKPPGAKTGAEKSGEEKPPAASDGEEAQSKRPPAKNPRRRKRSGVPCPKCKSRNTKATHTGDLKQYRKCRKCGHTFSIPRK